MNVSLSLTLKVQSHLVLGTALLRKVHQTGRLLLLISVGTFFFFPSLFFGYSLRHAGLDFDSHLG